MNDWLVFPVDGKVPLTARGHLDARRRDEWPDDAPGWAVSCAASGLLVVDVDPRNGGLETAATLDERHGFPETLTAFTGGGGLHLYYRKPPGDRFRKTLGPGIDVKVNGYVVIPPSPHASGRRYEWANDATVAECPAWLMAMAMLFRPDDQYEPIGAAAESFLGRAFAAAGMLGRVLDDTRVCVTCPWASWHSSTAESSTILFAPTRDEPLGRFHCSHTSHGTASAGAVLDALPVDAVARALNVA